MNTCCFLFLDFLNDCFHQHDNLWEFHMFHKKIYPCVINGLSLKTMRYVANCIAIPIFGRLLGKSSSPRGVSVVGRSGGQISNGWLHRVCVFGGDGSWNLGTTSKDLAFQGRDPPGGEALESRPFWAGFFFLRKEKKIGRAEPAVCFGVEVCLVCVFFWGGRGWGGKLGFWCCLIFKICLEVSQRSSPVDYGDFGKIFMISMYLPAF